MSHPDLSEAHVTLLHERLEFMVPRIVRNCHSERERLLAIGEFMAGTLAALQEEILPCHLNTEEEGGKEEAQHVELAIDDSPVSGYDNATLNILAERDRQLKAENVSDEIRRSILSDLQRSLMFEPPKPKHFGPERMQPTTLPDYDDKTLTEMAKHDARLKRMGYPEAQRKLFLERLMAHELIVQASERPS